MFETKANLTTRATISAKVTRADGTVEEIGVIAHVDPNETKAGLLHRLKGKVKK